MPASHYRRSLAMRMLRQGEISIIEAAQIALVSKQRVRVWCENAGIEPKTARRTKIAKILTRLNEREEWR